MSLALSLCRFHEATSSMVERFGKTPLKDHFNERSSQQLEFLPSPELPAAPSIREKLEEIGLSSALVERLSEVYTAHVQKLQGIAKDNRTNTLPRLTAIPCHRLNNPLNDGLQRLRTKLIQDRYMKEVEEFLAQTISCGRELKSLELRNAQLSDHGVQESHKNIHSFQTTYRPLLENFFKREGFPNRQDKELMAQKTGMKYNQIHNWFQNRRARAKRDGERINHYPYTTPRKLDQTDLLDDIIKVSDSSSEHSDRRNRNMETAPVAIINSKSPNIRVLPREAGFEIGGSVLDILECLSLPSPAASHYPHHFSLASPSVAMPKEPSSSGLFRRSKSRVAHWASLEHDTSSDLVWRPFLAMFSVSVDASISDMRGETVINSEEVNVPKPCMPTRSIHQVQPFHMPSNAASRSFSEAFELQESLTSFVSDSPLASPRKRRRISPSRDSSTPLMSLAEVCSATSPIKFKQVTLSPKRLSTTTSILRHISHVPSSYPSPLSSPHSSSSSLAPTSPPSSPLSYSSDFSDRIFSGSSGLSSPEAITPPSSSLALPSSDSPLFGDPFSPSLSPSEELFSMDTEIRTRSRVSSDRSTSSPVSSCHVPQIIRKISIQEYRFASSAAGHILQLSF